MSARTFQHCRIGVQVDALTPDDSRVPAAVLEKVFETATRRGVRIGQAGSLRYVKIASRSALVAMKLFGSEIQDTSDIIALINSGHIDLTPFPLSRSQVREYHKLLKRAAREIVSKELSHR